MKKDKKEIIHLEGHNKAISFKRMPKELLHKVERMTKMQRLYADFRAKGMTQAEAAKRAGSKSQDVKNLSKVGYNMESGIEGLKDYINWLVEARTQAAAIDHIEVITMIRQNYDAAFASGKYKDANDSVKLLAEISGLISKSPKASTNPKDEILLKEKDKKVKTRNKLDAFKEDDINGEISSKERVQKLKSLINKVK